MSGASYRGFVKVLEKWPLDQNKAGKDLGEALRQLFSHNFPLGSSTVVSEKVMDKQVTALQSLVSSTSLSSFPCQVTTTFTLLDQETLAGITSTELMGQMTGQAEADKAAKPGLLQRIKNIKIIR
eukprot:GFUD01024472.1.p2 GENE.GFUD01024472.1~~GFUD01024472.1.p2  ORF type:complete len:125 (-),score=52.82 GFUD01024472.1:501-875(-)